MMNTPSVVDMPVIGFVIPIGLTAVMGGETEEDVARIGVAGVTEGDVSGRE